MGTHVVITGGSDGIGYAIAERFATAGADVTLIARNADKLAAAAESLSREGARVHTVAADLSSVGAADDAAGQILRVTDTVDALFNNAGLAGFSALADTSDALVDAMLTLNVKVPLTLTRALLPALSASRGAVVNISSYWARKMVAGRPSSAYSATRAAIEGMTRALASELGPRGIRVNAVAPGAILTSTYRESYLAAMSPSEREDHDRRIATAYPLQRLGQPEDVAAAAHFLSSPEAGWITGVVLPVDGGLVTR